VGTGGAFEGDGRITQEARLDGRRRESPGAVIARTSTSAFPSLKVEARGQSCPRSGKRLGLAEDRRKASRHRSAGSFARGGVTPHHALRILPGGAHFHLAAPGPGAPRRSAGSHVRANTEPQVQKAADSAVRAPKSALVDDDSFGSGLVQKPVAATILCSEERGDRSTAFRSIRWVFFESVSRFFPQNVLNSRNSRQKNSPSKRPGTSPLRSILKDALPRNVSKSGQVRSARGGAPSPLQPTGGREPPSSHALV
jgi:hypothetical protein